MKKYISLILLLIIVTTASVYFTELYKPFKYYKQLIKEHIPFNKDQQPSSQKDAHYVG